ncbi:uncharacterized protein J3R85_001977 [Psidium guajava]|nr:uncharacterized protein J3R85_001977 [Psidium guajava]
MADHWQELDMAIEANRRAYGRRVEAGLNGHRKMNSLEMLRYGNELHKRRY